MEIKVLVDGTEVTTVPLHPMVETAPLVQLPHTLAARVLPVITVRQVPVDTMAAILEAPTTSQIQPRRHQPASLKILHPARQDPIIHQERPEVDTTEHTVVVNKGQTIQGQTPQAQHPILRPRHKVDNTLPKVLPPPLLAVQLVTATTPQNNPLLPLNLLPALLVTTITPQSNPQPPLNLQVILPAVTNPEVILRQVAPVTRPAINLRHHLQRRERIITIITIIVQLRRQRSQQHINQLLHINQQLTNLQHKNLLPHTKLEHINPLPHTNQQHKNQPLQLQKQQQQQNQRLRMRLPQRNLAPPIPVPPTLAPPIRLVHTPPVHTSRDRSSPGSSRTILAPANT